jgi:hypothetical protein
VLGGWDAYQTYHHKIAHLALFHLHLVMDFVGSGPGWGIYYFWPFSQWAADNMHYLDRQLVELHYKILRRGPRASLPQ